MTEKFAVVWAATLFGLMFAAFALDMLFGPFLLRNLHSPEQAFIGGLVYAALALGPMFWLAFVGD